VTPLAAGSLFGAFVSDAKIPNAVTVAPDNTTLIGLAFPSDWDWASSNSNRTFVTLGDRAAGSVAASGMADVYRVNGAATGSRAYALGFGLNPVSAAYLGNSTSGILAAGDFSSNTVGSATGAATANTLTWNFAAKPPSYSCNAALPNVGSVKLRFKPGSTPAAYTLYAWDGYFTGSAFSNYGSGVFVSTDLNSFNGVSFLSVSDLTKTRLGSFAYRGAEQYVFVNDDPLTAGVIKQAMLWRSTDNGTSWTEILNLGNTPVITGAYFSPTFDTDKTIWIPQGFGTTTANTYGNRVVKSTDAGATWSPLGTPGGNYTTSFALKDANTYWLGSSAGIQLNNINTATALTNGDTPKVMISFGPSLFFVATDVGSVYASTDGGVTFTLLGNAGQFGAWPFNFTFDVPNKTFYCQKNGFNGGDIMKFVVGTSSAWASAMAWSQMPATLTATGISGMQFAPNGCWYIASFANVTGQLWRSVDALTNTSALNYDLEVMPASTVAQIGTVGGPYITPFTDIATKNTVVWCYANYASSQNSYKNTAIEIFTDSLLTPPKVSAPADKATLANPVSFSWSPINYTGVRYEFQVGYDAGFTNLATSPSFVTVANPAGTADVVTPSTVFNNATLQDGTMFYFRVRVAPTFPIAGLWSAPLAFTTKVTSVSSANTPGLDTAGRLFPASGATNISLTSPITWGTVTSATGYDFKLATDPGFTQIVDSKTNVNTNVYAPSAPLKANTTYFWEVRALNGTTAGDWIVSAFTTGSGAAAPVPGATAPPVTQPPLTIPPITVPTPVVTVNVPPSTGTTTPPATPGYIWVIIAIGAVLVIAVIVLIARTRRV